MTPFFLFTSRFKISKNLLLNILFHLKTMTYSCFNSSTKIRRHSYRQCSRKKKGLVSEASLMLLGIPRVDFSLIALRILYESSSVHVVHLKHNKSYILFDFNFRD